MASTATAGSKRVIVIPASLRSSMTSGELQAVFSTGRTASAISHVRPGSSISLSSSSSTTSSSNPTSGSVVIPEKPKRKRQRLDHLTQDEKIMRRKMKNRMAAQTARDRKKVKMTDLESEVTKMQHSNEQLVKKNILLTNRLKEAEDENKRLRAQLQKLGKDVECQSISDDSATASPHDMLNDMLLNDIDLMDMDEFLELDHSSDIASDDSGYLFSDSSRNSGLAAAVRSSLFNAGSPAVFSAATSSLAGATTAAAALSAQANALESAAFINDPQQQEQALAEAAAAAALAAPNRLDGIRAHCSAITPAMISALASSSVSRSTQAMSMSEKFLSLVTIAKQELANLSLSGVPSQEPGPSTLSQPQPKKRKKRRPDRTETTLSYNGHLKTFLILLQLLCLKMF